MASAVEPLIRASLAVASSAEGLRLPGCQRSSCHRVLTRNQGGRMSRRASGLVRFGDGEPAEEGDQGFPCHRGRWHRQRRRQGAPGRCWRGVSAHARGAAVRAWVRLDAVAFQRPVERCPGSVEAQDGKLGQQGGRPQVRVVGQPVPAVGGEASEVVVPGRRFAGGAPPEHVVADRLGAVAVGRGDPADAFPGGMLGHDQLGPVPGQHVRHRFGAVRGGAACAVMSIAIWSRLLRVIVSVPSRMAWQDASRRSQSRLPIMPRVRRCR
jgi:hypothetical protein